MLQSNFKTVICSVGGNQLTLDLEHCGAEIHELFSNDRMRTRSKAFCFKTTFDRYLFYL